MDATEVVRVIGAIDEAGIHVGITGGWGIDALLGRVTRQHADVDLGLSSADIESAIVALGALGYEVTVDQRPARLELRAGRDKVDLHPIVWDDSGAGVQTGFDGKIFEYPPGSLEARGKIDGREVRCATPALQLTFHEAYLPRPHDRDDMAALAAAFDITLPTTYPKGATDGD